MFKGLDSENKTFTLMHCWNKLKGEDKLKAKRKEMEEQKKEAAKKKQKIHTDSMLRNVEVNNTEDVTLMRRFHILATIIEPLSRVNNSFILDNHIVHYHTSFYDVSKFLCVLHASCSSNNGEPRL